MASSGMRVWGFRLEATHSRRTVAMDASAVSYQKFVSFALEETKLHTHLVQSPLQEKFSYKKSIDGKSDLKMLSFQAPKIRILRSLCIESSESVQVLDFAVFPEPVFDLPIFCASFFAAASMNIIVLDLNPLHDTISRKDYKEKYYNNLLPLGQKYAEQLPWGGKITGESLRFFSPIVIWTKFAPSQYKYDVLYSAFVDYYKAWLELMDQAVEEKEASQINFNREAQHRYLTWRAEKDPGHNILKRLIGDTCAKELVWSFLFSGVNTLGSKTFLDYFPEYGLGDGTINERRSMIGKSFETRPWNTRGDFVGNDVR